MAVISVTADNIRLDDAESTTQWGSIGGGAGGSLETDFVYQSSNCFARKGATAQRGIFLSDDVDSDISGAGTYKTVIFKFICTTPGLLELKSVPGMKLSIGSGSITASPSVNYHTYNVQGRDTYPLTKSWLIIAIDPNISVHRDSTTGTPDLTLADYYALEYDQTAVSKSPNQALDAVDIGAGLTLVGGDGADTDGVWQDFIDFDEGTVANRFGYVTTVEGILFVLGRLVLGTASATVFNDSGKTLVFPDGLFAQGFSGITVDLQTAATDIDLINSNFFGKGSATGEETRPVLTVTGTSGAFDSDNCVFDSFDVLTLTSAATLLDCTISNSLSIIQSGATIDGCTIFGATTADGVSFITSDNLTLIKNCKFTFSDGHALELTSAHADSPTEHTFDGNTFSGYGADGTNDAAIFNNSGKSLIINITNGDTPTVRNGSGASTTINNNVTATITVKDEDSVVIQSARVSVRLDSDNSEILGGLTNSSGIVTGSVAANQGAVHVIVRKGSGGGTDYVPVSSGQNVGAGNFDVSITLVEDTLNAT